MERYAAQYHINIYVEESRQIFFFSLQQQSDLNFCQLCNPFLNAAVNHITPTSYHTAIYTESYKMPIMVAVVGFIEAIISA